MRDGHDTVVAEVDARVLRLGCTGDSFEFHFPEGWSGVPSDEDDLWCWELPGIASSRVRLRRSPHIQFEVEVTNTAGEPAAIEAPTIIPHTVGTEVDWFAGSAGEIVHVLQDSTVLWRQLRGTCVARPGGFSPFPEPLRLQPGQAASSAWRRHHLPAGSLPPEPSWVPRQRYFQRGEVLEVSHSDAGLLGPEVEVRTTADGSEIRGPVGLHDLAFLDARGTAIVEVGWFDSLESLALAALQVPGLDPNVASWLNAGVAASDQDLDALDVALAEALEYPSAWGVLAGMRAVTLTDLPVAADVREVAPTVFQQETDAQLRGLLVAHAAMTGWEPQLAAQWMPSLHELPLSVQSPEALSRIGLGRVTSAPITYSGRDVALAAVWLASCPESAVAAEYERAVDTARARLMCHLSAFPEPDEVGWLLAEALLR